MGFGGEYWLYICNMKKKKSPNRVAQTNTVLLCSFCEVVFESGLARWFRFRSAVVKVLAKTAGIRG